jgi:hypothetical protein
MNPVFRHHHVTDHPGDSADSTPNGGVDNWTDPADQTWTPWPGSDAAGSPFEPTPPDLNLFGAVPAVEEPPSSGTGTGTIITYGPGTGLVINVAYDSTVTGLMTSNPTLYAEYIGAVQAAVNFYEAQITNPVSINITFGYGEVNGNPIGGAAGESEYFYNTFSYATLYNAAKNILDAPSASAVQKAAFATLSATDPTNGNGLFRVDVAEQKALGLGSNTGTDGFVGISSTLPFSWTEPNAVGGNYDAVAVFEHEISEVMGRSDALGAADFNNPSLRDYTLLDFFHYAAAGGASNAAFGSAAGVLNEPFVSGYNASLQSYFSYNGTTVTLPYDTPAQVAAGDDVADWTNTVSSDSYGFAIQGQTGLVSPTDLQAMNVLGYDLACFLPGTQIATPTGEVPVENLALGDRILTHRGGSQLITWIGRGKALATRGRRNAATPVIVRKGALADNVPNRELRITKGHSLYLDGVLIPAEFLVNHRSILWDDRAQEVDVYHVELATHDVLLANGAPAETYRDDGNRWLFRNINDTWRQDAKPPCAPVLTGGPVVDAIWHRLLARSGPRPGLPLTSEPDLHLLVDGCRIDGRLRPNGVYVFRFTTAPGAVHIVSRAGVQDELGLARDPRALGVALRQIFLWRGRYLTIIAADDPRLRQGFHAYEEDNDFRWTDGDAVLPASLFAGTNGAFDLELHVGCSTHYPLFDDQTRTAA